MPTDIIHDMKLETTFECISIEKLLHTSSQNDLHWYQMVWNDHFPVCMFKGCIPCLGLHIKLVSNGWFILYVFLLHPVQTDYYYLKSIYSTMMQKQIVIAWPHFHFATHPSLLTFDVLDIFQNLFVNICNSFTCISINSSCVFLIKGT